MKLSYTRFQKALEFITVIILLGTFIYLILSWGKLPDKIPAHYNAAGIVDRWGSKNEILTLPIMSIVLYILLTIVSFFPSIWNAPVKITEGNRWFVYCNLKTMLILIKMEIIILFCYMTYCNIKVNPLGIWFLPIELIVLFATVIYYIIKVRR